MYLPSRTAPRSFRNLIESAKRLCTVGRWVLVFRLRPSMFALADSSFRAAQIAELMVKVLTNKQIECESYVSKVNSTGAKII